MRNKSLLDFLGGLLPLMVRERYSSFKNSIAQKTKPILDALKPVTSPITNIWNKIYQPFNTFYLQKTKPIRDWYNNLYSKSPIIATALLWTYDILRTLLIILIILILLSMFGVFGYMPSKKDLRTIENSNTTEIYSADSVLIGKFFIENRTEISLDKISPYVITALLAVEDKRFFEHSGIDLRSWLRVFKGIAMSTSSLGGGSTLSQQLAKNLYPRRKYYIPGVSLLINKIRENIIGIKLESIYNKEELLSLYLNTVPFGGDRFGINVASKYFFSKKAKDLNPGEAATLIGMLKATTALDPTRNPNNSKKRRNLVLSQMVKNSDFEFNSEELSLVTKMIKNGRLTQEEFDKIKDKPINAQRNTTDDTYEGKGAYFREYLRTTAVPNILKKLIKEDGTRYNQYRDGLKIYTTLDSKLQNFAEAAVIKHMSSLQTKFNKHWKGYKEELPWGDDKWLIEQKKKSERYRKLIEAEIDSNTINEIFDTPVKMTVFSWKNGGSDTDTIMSPMDSIKHYFLMLNTGFMAMDYKTGFIKSWVGGTNFKYFKFDHNLSKRQVGSTFKPIVYAAAIRDSVRPCQFLKNEQITVGDWTPRNADNTYGGWASVVGGITYSINTIAAKLIQKVGIQKTLDLAALMGVTAELPREFGISLGAAEISLYDMMKVYGTIANKGIRPEPVVVLKIKDRNGKVIYDYEEELKKNSKLGPHVQALSEDEAAIMKRMMQSVIDQGTGRKFRDAYGAVGEYAGKTGTTQRHSDGWFIVFNPYLVTGAWVGGPSTAVRFRDMNLGQGSAMALPIVGEYWKSIRNDKNFRKITDTKFEENETAINLVGCPFRIGIHPDTLDLLMQDSILKDSIVKNGYRNLRKIAADKFGIDLNTDSEIEETEEILEGGEVEKKNQDKKEEDKELTPKLTTIPDPEIKRVDDKKSNTKEKPIDKKQDSKSSDKKTETEKPAIKKKIEKIKNIEEPKTKSKGNG
jgi:penicillin-binding protein 1A